MPAAWPIEQLTEELERSFLKRNRKEEWAAERAELKRRIEALAAELTPRYRALRVGGLGGSGVVLQLADRQLADQPCALKFPRAVAGKSDLMKVMLEDETRHLLTIRHPAVVRIHTTGFCGTKGGAATFPFYVMDWVAGESSDQYLRTQADLSQEDVLQLITHVLAAIEYMHRNELAHLDIKEQNVLVTDLGMPVLADLGTTKAVRTETTETVVATTSTRADPAFLRMLDKDPSDEDRSKGSVRRSSILLKFDLVPLGLMVYEWLAIIAEREIGRTPILTPLVRKYLLLMVSRLSADRLPHKLLERLGLREETLRPLTYQDIGVAVRDMSKLTGAVSLPDLIPELNLYGASGIQVNAAGLTPLTTRVQSTIDHPMVARLRSVTQLGLVNQVYPTAQHTRLEHCLGTFHHACRSILSLYNDPVSPFFRQLMTEQDLRATLLAAIIHDAGQFPLAHDLEEIDSGFFDHQDLTRAVIKGVRQTKKSGSRKLKLPDFAPILGAWQVSSDRLLSILDARPDGSPLKDQILHSIIDGPIDADKLDYLQRDSARCLVAYGAGIDVDRVQRSLTVAISDRGSAAIGVHEKGRPAAEFVGMVRTTMFSTVYWHHAVRSMKAMLARAVGALLADLGPDTRARSRLQSEFEQFVLNLPASIFGREPLKEGTPGVQQLVLATGQGPTTADHEWRPADMVASGISQGDAAVLLFLRQAMEDKDLAEASLLTDLLNRRLYQRAYVFSSSRDESEREMMSETWHRLSTHRQRQAVHRELERQVLLKILGHHQSAPPTAAIDQSLLSRLRLRVDGHQPLLLVDFPGRRPAAPLLYVLEEQRRTLRKDDRVIGECRQSEVWNKLARDLHEQAGKVRVFAHPDYVEAILAAVDHVTFVGMFQSAVHSVG